MAALCLVSLLSATASVLALQQPAPAARAQRQQVTPAQAELYERWRANINTNQRQAYDAGREYIAKYPADEYGALVSVWVMAYERAARKAEFRRLLDAERHYADAYALGQQVLADDPDDVKTIFSLAYAAYLTPAPRGAELAEAAYTLAVRAIALLEADRKPEDWRPFADKSDALGYLNLIVGEVVYRRSPAEAIPYFRRAVGYDSSVSRAPIVYARLAEAYVATEYATRAREYAARYSGKDQTPESLAALERLYPSLDRVIDALARAVATTRGSNDSQMRAAGEKWRVQLAEFYKSRHAGSLDGLDALIVRVATQPLP